MKARFAGFKVLVDEPFRIFFPLGAIWSFVGVFYWVLKVWAPWLENVSSKVHVWTQIYGFMGCFVIGFLGTAVPRFTDSRYLRLWEILVLMVTSTWTMVNVLREDYLGAHTGFFVSILFLALCLVPRFLKRQSQPPVTFVFIPFAILAALAGSGLSMAIRLGFHWRLTDVNTVASNLIFQGFIIFLLMGIGGFLIRSILGWLAPLPEDPGEKPVVPMTTRQAIAVHGLCALVIFLSFWFEVFVSRPWGAGIRAALVTAEAVWQMKIHRNPTSGKLGARCLQLALWLLLAGLWGDAVISSHYPRYRLAFLHLCFVGGFSMSAFAVASRVVFSHARLNEFLRGSYKPLTVAQVFLFIGLLSRFGADFTEKGYDRHLFYAALSWVCGLLIWCAWVLVRAFVQVPEAEA